MKKNEVKKRIEMLENHSSMTLYQLFQIVLESEIVLLDDDVNPSDVNVFFTCNKTFKTHVNVKLRRNEELNSYILVFDVSD